MLTILQGDALKQLQTLPDESVQCCVTSPPYWGLRDYSVPNQLGLEKTPEEYVAKLVAVFREVCRVLRKDGVCWLNLGDSYASAWPCNRRNLIGNGSLENGKREARAPRISEGLKEKDLIGIPWRVAFALQADGWWLRQDIIWSKPNPMPESVTDRCTKAHEYVFLLTKSARYYYDAEAIQDASVTNDIRRPYGSLGAWQLDGRPEEQRHGGEPRSFKGSKFNAGKTAVHQLNRSSLAPRLTGDLPDPAIEFRNKRSVWTVTTQPYPEAHFATYPPDLIKPMILAGTSAKGCCAKCGAPWERLLEKVTNTQLRNAAGKNNDAYQRGRVTPRNSPIGDFHDLGTVSVKELGWQPTCDCGVETVAPCTVLDPFAGSGTTGQVAIELGRRAILIELNPEYIPLIKARCDVTPGLPLCA